MVQLKQQSAAIGIRTNHLNTKYNKKHHVIEAYVHTPSPGAVCTYARGGRTGTYTYSTAAPGDARWGGKRVVKTVAPPAVPTRQQII